jgi:hypothetical protein
MEPGTMVQHKLDANKGIGLILKVLLETPTESLYRVWWGPEHVGTARLRDLELVCK